MLQIAQDMKQRLGNLGLTALPGQNRQVSLVICLVICLVKKKL